MLHPSDKPARVAGLVRARRSVLPFVRNLGAPPQVGSEPKVTDAAQRLNDPKTEILATHIIHCDIFCDLIQADWRNRRD